LRRDLAGRKVLIDDEIRDRLDEQAVEACAAAAEARLDLEQALCVLTMQEAIAIEPAPQRGHLVGLDDAALEDGLQDLRDLLIRHAMPPAQSVGRLFLGLRLRKRLNARLTGHF